MTLKDTLKLILNTKIKISKIKKLTPTAITTNTAQMIEWKVLIPELHALHKDYRQKRAATKSVYNKYKTAITKFYFLDTILSAKKGGRIEDDLLEVAIKDLFNSVGIKSKIPSNKDNFDVISKFKETSLFIEVKNGNMPSENDMLQALKYAMRQGITKGVLVIWNNATTNQEFDSNRVNDAELHGYSIITTKELFKGYIRLKTNNISFEKFLAQFKKSGLIKFSSKALKEGL